MSSPGTKDLDAGPHEPGDMLIERRRASKALEVEAVTPEPLTGDAFHLYQRLAALANYHAADRWDILYAAKECMRRMTDPNQGSLIALKRMVRFLKWKPRCVARFAWGGDPREVVTFGDANFAACARTRKSTCGGVIHWAGKPVKAWSRTIGVICLS